MEHTETFNPNVMRVESTEKLLSVPHVDVDPVLSGRAEDRVGGRLASGDADFGNVRIESRPNDCSDLLDSYWGRYKDQKQHDNTTP